MTVGRLWAISAIAILAVGSALAMQTTTEFDSQTDFARYKTWSWGPSGVPGNPVAEKRVREAVEAQLQSKGWSKLKEGEGDAVVAAHGAVRQDESLDVLYSGWAPGWNWGGVGVGTGVGTTVQKRVRSGTLVIDLFDAATKKLIWRGTAEDTMDATVEANQKKIDQAVARLFKRFPPEPVKK